jgi:chromosome segregation ATPase
VREEALGQLQQERAALEEAQATLKQREDEVLRLNGELVQISISHEDLCQSLEEQEATILNLQRQADEALQSLEGEKKQVEGKFPFARFSLVNLPFRDSVPTLFFFVCGFQACGPPWGT